MSGDQPDTITLNSPDDPPSLPARISYLDGWRGLAIVTVLLSHFAGRYGFPLELAGFGVDLFFVLSGRLMADILFVARQPLLPFFQRRFSRIYPALLFYTVSMVLLAVALDAGGMPSFVRWWQVVGALTFTINYVEALTGVNAVNFGAIWSLSVEEHCYIMLAIIAVLLARRSGRAVYLLTGIGVVALANGIRLGLSQPGDLMIYWRTDTRLSAVFLSAAAFLWLRRATPPPRLARLLGWLPLPLVTAVIILFVAAPMWVAYAASAVLLAVAVNVLDFSGPGLQNVLSTRVLTAFGAWSYSIYLWQQPFYMIKYLVAPALLAPVAIITGIASYRFVEQPARRWINTWRLGPAPDRGSAGPAQ